MKPNHSALGRIFHAANYSKEGLVAAFKSEAAFRQELGLFVILAPAIFFLPFSLEFKALLIFCNTLVLITEIINSAIEAVVDMVSPDFNEYAKKAKDMGSAAVFVSLMLCLISWVLALFSLST